MHIRLYYFLIILSILEQCLIANGCNLCTQYKVLHTFLGIFQILFYAGSSNLNRVEVSNEASNKQHLQLTIWTFIVRNLTTADLPCQTSLYFPPLSHLGTGNYLPIGHCWLELRLAVYLELAGPLLGNC
jgi:hypothetical protein